MTDEQIFQLLVLRPALVRRILRWHLANARAKKTRFAGGAPAGNQNARKNAKNKKR